MFMQDSTLRCVGSWLVRLVEQVSGTKFGLEESGEQPWCMVLCIFCIGEQQHLKDMFCFAFAKTVV